MGSAVAVMDVPPTGRINVQRIVLGGIIAGLVINVSEFVLNRVVLGADMTASLDSLNLTPVAGAGIAIFIALGLIDGIAAIWLYAAMRPRFGPGPKTAVLTGLAVWFFCHLNSAVAMHAMRMFHRRLLGISVVWQLGESVVAALAGSAFYTEK